MTMIPFPGQTCPIAYASREVIEWRGRDSERWVVMIRQPDGSETWLGPMKTKADAVGIAALMADGWRKDRERASANPLADALAKLSEGDRRMMTKALRQQFGDAP